MNARPLPHVWILTAMACTRPAPRPAPAHTAPPPAPIERTSHEPGPSAPPAPPTPTHDFQRVPFRNALALSCSRLTVCALQDDHTVRCRDPHDPDARCEGRDARADICPIRVPATAEELDGDAGFGCVRTHAGEVFCWGALSGDWGECPDESFQGHDFGSRAPSRIALREPAVEIAVDFRAACARGRSGAVYCWGDVREIPAPGAHPRRRTVIARPARQPFDLADRLVMEDRTVLARTTAGRWQAGGFVTLARFGLLTPDYQRFDDVVNLDGLDADELVFGALIACTRGARGDVTCWRRDASSQMADPHRPARPQTLRLPPDASLSFAGPQHVCALTPNGGLWCTSPTADATTSPTFHRVEGLAPVAAGCADYRMNCVLTRDGAVYCET